MWRTGAPLLLISLLGADGVCGQAPAARQDGPPLEVPRLSGPVELDGRVDEPAWAQVEPLPLTMFAPTYGGAPTEETELRIAHDDQYLYVAGRMYETDPSQIRTNTFYRDGQAGDDLMAVVIDSYNDHETAVWFVTNPAGARQDRTVFNDGEFTSGMPMNWDWNSHWDAVTSRDERGWYAELRIPFSTLGFQTTGREVTMGLIAYRYIARKNERQMFPAIDPKWGGLAFAKPSQARRVVLRDVRQSKPVYLTPYSLGGFNQSPVLRGPPEVPAEVWATERDPTREVGFDLKYSPTSNLALDVTVNTDFAQVEADEEQINLTRFALFFPEKRQFFQERSSTFDFGTGGFTNRLFHSRQIGLDRGEIVRIYGGARGVGRIRGTDFGLLTMQTAPHGGRSSENVGVLRLRQQVLNPYSSVGAMVTSRLGSYGGDNVAYGLDGLIRPVGDEYMLVQWAHTFDEAAVQAGGMESGLLRARWERRRDEGFSYHGEVIRVGADYLPGLGFQLRKDFTFRGGQIRYNQYRDEASPLQWRGVNVSTAHYFRNADGTAESREWTPQLEFELKSGAHVTFEVKSIFESVPDSFPISDVFIPPGEYWYNEGKVMYRRAWGDLFRGEFNATAGSFFDGTRVGVDLKPTWTLSRYLELSGGYQVNRLEFADRDASTTAHLGSLKLQVALNTHISLISFAQYSSATDLTTLNARFRYHFREGTDLWVVYNEGLHTIRDNGLGPRRPFSAGRAVMVKYSHTFIR